MTEIYNMMQTVENNGVKYNVYAVQECSVLPAIRDYCDSEIDSESEIEFEDAWRLDNEGNEIEKIVDGLEEELFDQALQAGKWE